MAPISSAIVGLGFLLLGVLIPELISDVALWVRLALCGLGFLLVVGGTWAGLRKARSDRDSAGISVNMRDGNVIGRIGHSNVERREEDG